MCNFAVPLPSVPFPLPGLPSVSLIQPISVNIPGLSLKLKIPAPTLPLPSISLAALLALLVALISVSVPGLRLALKVPEFSPPLPSLSPPPIPGPPSLAIPCPLD